MISFLSAIVVMLAIGTVVQRADILSGDGSGDDVVALIDDSFVVSANSLQKLEIFENDTGLSDEDRATLTILSEPTCGRLLAGGGIVKYYATDDCVGAQQFVYTVGSLPDAQVATVKALVVSERLPAAVRQTEEAPMAAAPQAGTEAGAGEKSADAAEEVVAADDSTSELTGGAATPAGAEETEFVAPLDDGDGEMPFGGETLAGAPDEETPVVAEGEATEQLVIARADPEGAVSVSEDEPARGLPGYAPATPEIAEMPDSGIVATAPDDGAVGIAPDQPVNDAETLDEPSMTLSLAMIQRREEVSGPKDTRAEDALAIPDFGTDHALVPDEGSDITLREGERRGPSDLTPSEMSPEVAALDTDSVPDTGRIEVELVEGVATGQVPIPVMRSTLFGAVNEVTEGSGDAAAIDTEDGADGLEIATLAPAGTDLMPAPLTLGVRDESGLAGHTADLGDDIGTRGIGLIGKPAGSDDAVPGKVPSAGLPATGPGEVAELGRGGGALSDAGAEIEAPDAPVAAMRGDGEPDKRFAALSPGLAAVPRGERLRDDLEPDPVERAGEPVGVVDPRVPGLEGAGVAASDDAEGPAAEREAALVTNDAASSYSFFTAIPRREARDGDQRIMGAERPAGSFALDLADGALPLPADTTLRLAGIAPAAALDADDVPGPALAAPLREMEPEPVAPADGDEGTTDGTQTALLPQGDDACVTPPSTELEIRRGARTFVRIIAPCQAESVGELVYSGVRMAIPLNREGLGSVLALGFEANSGAVLTFTDGETISFDLPFRDIDKIDRIAVVWDQPVALELHALEFGASTGDPNHVNPKNPRNFKDVRRSGGGFLHSYRSYAGVGQNAQIYTFWRRRGVDGGIVKMMIDYASRNRDRLDGTCGDGAYAAPGFVVLRSAGGRMERPISRRLAAMECSRVSEEIGDKRLISGAIDDLVVTN